VKDRFHVRDRGLEATLPMHEPSIKNELQAAQDVGGFDVPSIFYSGLQVVSYFCSKEGPELFIIYGQWMKQA
jgi:hypothetical protein